jgi:type II secretory pathway pseudopilin PulG
MTKRRSTRDERGFTLVELMVAVTGGLFMSLIVFALARDGSRFYQRESRVADATLAAIAGFERVRGDLSRAGFMSSPNVRHDPTLCQDRGTFQGLLASLATIRVERPTATGDAQLNSLTPDRLVLAGNYTTFDQYPMLGLEDLGGDEFAVDLQVRLGPLARAGYAGMSETAQAEYLQNAFPVGRVLRIVTGAGRTQYARISGVTQGASPKVEVDTKLGDLTLRSAGDCGLKEIETSGAVNVVNFVQYDVRRLEGDATFGALYEDKNPYDVTRTELVRSELDPLTGDALANTTEVVAEYTVNFSVALTVVSQTAGANVRELSDVPFGHASILTWAGDPATSTAAAGAHRVRAVRLRLAVRSREPDRAENIVGNSEGSVAPGLYRVAVAAGTNPPYARVRTMQADLVLHNQMGITW